MMVRGRGVFGIGTHLLIGPGRGSSFSPPCLLANTIHQIAPSSFLIRNMPSAPSSSIPLCIFSPTGESRFWPKRLWVGQCSSVRNVGRTDGRTDLILALGKFCISAKERMSQQKKGEAKLRKGIERLHSWHASITKGLLDISFTQSAKIGAQSDL